MRKLNTRLMLIAVAAAALVAGCGGGGGGGDTAAADSPTPDTPSAMKSIEFVKNLIDNNGENSDPDDINPITLAVDDTAEPTAL